MDAKSALPSSTPLLALGDVSASKSAKGHPDAEPPYAFLCSVCQDYVPVAGRSEPVVLREKIHAMGRKPGRRPVWVAECSKPEMGDGWHHADIIDTCINFVRKAQIFVCVFHGRFGSRVNLLGRVTRSSFIEMEIFAALLAQKEIHIFVAKGFEPDPDLKSLIDILAIFLPDFSNIKEKDEGEILDGIELLLSESKPTLNLLRFPWRVGPGMVSTFAGLLANQRWGGLKAGPDASVLFLNGRFGDARGADKDLISELLALSKDVSDQQKKLARLWLVGRELMGVPFAEQCYAEFLPLWDTFLGQWSSAAAWYGMHSHLYLGMAAALHTQVRVRAVAREQRTTRYLEHTEPPDGPLASAYYSMAKHMPTRHLRSECLQAAMNHVGRAIVENVGNMSGYHAIRGSIYLTLGESDRAIDDYETVCKLRRATDTGDGAMGEALSELGFAYVRCGRMFRLGEGVRLMKEGVALLSRGPRSGFLIRAKVKLAMGYLATLHPCDARRELADAKRIAEEESIFDKLSNIPLLERMARFGCPWGNDYDS